MKRILGAVGSVVATLLMAASVASAGRWYQNVPGTQTAGVVDSMAATADTSDVVTIPTDATAVFFVTLADTNAIRYIQVRDTNNRWATAVFDTVVTPAGDFTKARVTADLVGTVRGRPVRVIIDRLRAAAGWTQNIINYER